jgi:hypothetical protein
VGSLESRLRALEGRGGKSKRPPTSRTAEEFRAIDAEIRDLEEEMRAEGIDPRETLGEVQAFLEGVEGLSLDEKIRALEEEIAREEQEHDN